MNKLLASSVNPQELSMTIKGLLLGIIPLVSTLLKLWNIELGQEQLTLIVDAIIGIFTALFAVWSAWMVFYGLIRKVGVSLKK
jgi:hypothetical protein